MSGTTNTDRYRDDLTQLDDWDDYLLANSSLPGPRGNLELAEVVADLGTQEQFARWLTYDATIAPVNTPQEFLAFCGTVGLGRLIAEGQDEWWPVLRRQAADPRWRTREAVAMALQRVGDRDISLLLSSLSAWAAGSWLEQRAASAAVSEPRLLRDPVVAVRALALLDQITNNVATALPTSRMSDEFRTLRQALGYCWSVVVAALPEYGKPALERWSRSPNPDVIWIVRENLKKARLTRMDADWVSSLQAQIG